MDFERADNINSLQNLFDECKNLMNYHIILIMKDGTSVDGIIENVDSNGVIMMTGEDVLMDDDQDQYNTQRQFKGPRGMRRHRRFRRRGFPFNVIHGIFPIPFPFFPINPFFPFV